MPPAAPRRSAEVVRAVHVDVGRRRRRHTRRTMSFIMKEVLIDFANCTTISPYPLHSGFWGTMSPL
eukprot:4466128-Prymnesium_polylepis.1